MTWRHYTKSGRTTTDGPRWSADEAIVDGGGLLVVKAQAGGQQASASVRIRGTNPGEGRIAAYLKDKTTATS